MFWNIKNRIKYIRIFRLLAFLIRNFQNKTGFVRGYRNAVINKGIKVSTTFCINGNNNKIIIDKNTVLNKCSIYIIGDNSTIHFRKNCYVEGATLHIEDNGCTIVIGENTFIGQSHLACTENKKSIIIGDNCMLSSNIQIRTGDSHSIIDKNTNLRINHAQNITVGDHCWIGEGAKVLKGVTLEKDVIVASGSVVTQSFSSNLIIGGLPAKILKENVTWDKNRI